MPTSKLQIYKNALQVHLGARAVRFLTEETESRRALDTVWDGGGIRECLHSAQWNWAIRSARLDYDPSIAPPFGYQRAFEKPEDFILTAGVCSDEYFRQPIVNYQDNNGFWLCDLDTIFVRYVSDDVDYGMDLSKWPPNFTTYVEAYFALRIVKRLTGVDQLKAITQQDVKMLLRNAKATDAMEEPPGFKPTGSWTRARHGRYWRDRTPSGGLWE